MLGHEPPQRDLQPAVWVNKMDGFIVWGYEVGVCGGVESLDASCVGIVWWLESLDASDW